MGQKNTSTVQEIEATFNYQTHVVVNRGQYVAFMCLHDDKFDMAFIKPGVLNRARHLSWSYKRIMRTLVSNDIDGSHSLILYLTEEHDDGSGELILTFGSKTERDSYALRLRLLSKIYKTSRTVAVQEHTTTADQVNFFSPAVSEYP